MSKKMMSKLLMFAISVFSIVSCSSDDDEIYVEPEVGYGIITNASPNSGDLYFFADDNKINSKALNYTDAQGYYRFYEGLRTFRVKDNNGNVIDAVNHQVNNGKSFSLFAVNTFDQLELIAYNDNLVSPGAYNAGIRLINLSPDAPNVDLYLDGKLIVSAIPFKVASDFVNVEDNEYNLEIKDSQTGITFYQDSSVTLYPNRIYTLYTKGFVNVPSNSNDQFSLEIMRNY